MKRKIAKILAGIIICVTITTPAFGEASVNLSDISTHWGKANIERLVGMRAISGYPDGTFKPNNTISFAEFLSISVKSVMKDVKASPQGTHWATGVYQTAIEKGVFKSSDFAGTAERFNAPITREDMSFILIRLSEVAKNESRVDTTNTKSLIQDYSKIASNRQDAVLQAYQKGMLSGKGNGFDPKGNTTRAEAATVVVKLIDPSTRSQVKVEAPVVKTGTEKAKEVFNQLPTYQTKTDHGLSFNGVGYTLDDVAVFATDYLKVRTNYDATNNASMDKWEQELAQYLTSVNSNDLRNVKDTLLSSKSKAVSDVYVDASKIEIRDGRFFVHAIIYGETNDTIWGVELRIGSHDVRNTDLGIGIENWTQIK